jgi:hypothetical protein
MYGFAKLDETAVTLSVSSFFLNLNLMNKERWQKLMVLNSLEVMMSIK